MWLRMLLSAGVNRQCRVGQDHTCVLCMYDILAENFIKYT